MLDVLRKLSERVGGRLRRSGMHARSVGLKLRYRDFSTVTRQVTLPAAADGDEAIFNAVSDLLRKALNERSGAVRLLGVGVSGLGEPASQLSLLEVDSRKDSAISSAVDRIRDRFGDAAVRRGR
jgi:DNA polymerase-4